MMDYYARELDSALKKRGHSEETISQMSADHKFNEYCNWHGLIGWGETLSEIMKECQKEKSK